MKKMLETQQKVMDAAKYIMYYFGADSDYADILETMLRAQTQIVGLMELAKQQMINTNGCDELEFQTDTITLFLRDVFNFLQMMRPFAELSKEYDMDDIKPKNYPGCNMV
jgi:hypothetical protein